MIQIKNIIPRKYAATSQTTQYTAPSLTRTLIDKFTATNTGAAAATLTVNLVASGGSASNANAITKNVVIDVGEAYTCPELVGQVLEPGGFISTICGTASTIVLSCTAREIV